MYWYVARRVQLEGGRYPGQYARPAYQAVCTAIIQVYTHLESCTPVLWRYILVRTGTYRYVLFYSTY
jgi:hypothetical protein